MSSPSTGKDDTNNGNKSSYSGNRERNTLESNKMILSKEGMSALDVGGQQLQNMPHNLQGFKVLVLLPSKLKDLGLVTNTKTGNTNIMHESKDESSAENIAETLSSQLVPLLETQNISHEIVVPDILNVTDSEGSGEVVGISLNSQSLKESAVVNENKNESMQSVKVYSGVKRERFGEDTGTLQKVSNKLKSKVMSVHWSPLNIADGNEAVLSGDATPNSMEVWRCETRLHLPWFATHWQFALAEMGYINCPMMECNYISLSESDMISHHSRCGGKSSITLNACPICMHRLGTENDLKTHMLKSHPGDGFHRKTMQRVMVRSEWEMQPRTKLLAKRRSFNKVHKVSWNIAIESKGYVKCLFQNCSYLAITVDEMIKHYGICNGGGDVGVYPCPYKCPHCGGCVETEDKLQAHVRKSHTIEQPSFQIELTPSGSRNSKEERILPSLELMKPIKSESQVDKNSSHCQDSFIVTLNTSNNNEAVGERSQLLCVDEVKAEINRTDGYKGDSCAQDIHPSNRGESVHYNTLCPGSKVKLSINKKLPGNYVLSSKGDANPEVLGDEHEEHSVVKVKEVMEKNFENKVEAYDIVIEHVQKSMDCKTVALPEKPAASIQLVTPVSHTAKSELDVVHVANTPDISICSMEDPPDCVSTEADLNQHIYSESQLFSSIASGSRQSNNSDVMTDISVEDDTISHSNMNYMNQCSSIYSDDSYTGMFSQTGYDDGPIGNTLTTQFDSYKNMEELLVKGGSGDAKYPILKTYSRRTSRLNSNVTVSDVSIPVQQREYEKGVVCLKEEKSDATAGQQNGSTKGMHIQYTQCGKKSRCPNASGLSTSEIKMRENDLEMCIVCSELFSADEMVLHKNIHTGIKPHICVLCELKFNTKYRLKIHMKCHNVKKEITCEVCGKKFLSKKLLKRHTGSHSEDRPFECDVCSRKFKQSYQVTKHRKIHQGEKNHACDICGYATMHKACLQTHQKRHLGDYMLKCDICGKGFFSNCEFQEHKNVHTGDKPYMCDICGKSYRYKNSLMKHKRTHEPDAKPTEKGRE